MFIVGTQVLSLTCLFMSMVGAFFLPYWLVGRWPESFSGSHYQLGLSLANCVSGGVFIATFFIGLMPEVRNLFHEVLRTKGIKSEFPLTEFVIFVGFLLALAIEQYVLEYQEKNSTCYSSIPSGNDDDCNKNEPNSLRNPSKTYPAGLLVGYNSDSNNRTVSFVVKQDTHIYQNSSVIDHSYSTVNSHSSHAHANISIYMKGEAGIRIGMLMISLGVHSLFEGLALGLQTDVSVLVNLVTGVAVHELLVAFAMGVNVSRLKLPRSTALKLAFVFSASIPVGQLIGLVIGYNQSTTALTVSAVLQGLAAGTFIHVTFLEVIPAEFQERGFRILKVISLGLGFVLLLACTVALRSISPVNE